MSRDLHNLAMDTVMDFPFVENLVESFYIPGRPAKHVPVPRHLRSRGAGKWIAANRHFDPGMWNQQGVALNHLHDGKNVITTTSTSSGKSSIFIGHTLYTLDNRQESTVIGVQPAKALQTDQLALWKQAFANAGYKKGEIGIINGDERDHKIRLGILKNARHVMITPDVLHRWLLGNLQEPIIRRFLKNLEFTYLDEMHEYDEILGSHAPYLLKRLQFAVDALQRGMPNPRRLQFAAASASLKDAAGFMRNMTGQSFVEVGPDQDGSRRFDQDVVHIAASEREQFGVARSLITKFLTNPEELGEGAGICFMDSRQAVERMAFEINARLGVDATAPYIGGYTRDARNEIQFEIRNNKRRFIICTSVLELGVNFPDLSVGISVGKPASPNALQQRLGRVGRGRNGLYIVIAPRTAFKLGRNPITLKEHCQGGSELRLHPNHPIIVGGNALCLQKEIAALGLPPHAGLNDRRYEWGHAFIRASERLRNGAPLFDPDTYDQIRLKGRDPHIVFNLREISRSGRTRELIAALKDGKTIKLGTVPHHSAIYECYPGALMHHRLRKYEVDEWTYGEHGPQVRVRQVNTRDETYPLRDKVVHIDRKALEQRLPGSHPVITSRGRMQECSMVTIDEVIGYVRHTPGLNRTGKTETVFYNEEKGGELKKRYANWVHTTGVLLDFRRDIFDADEMRRLGQVIKEIYCDLHSLAPSTIDFVPGKVFQKKGEKFDHLENALVVFDRAGNGLRFTSKLISSLPKIIKIMADYPQDALLLDKFKNFYEKMTDRSLPEVTLPVAEAANDEAREETILRARTVVFWKARDETTKKKAPHPDAPKKINGGRRTEDWMVITGHKRGPDGEILYKIEPFQDPVRRKKTYRTPADHWVARSTLLVIPDISG